MFNSEIFSEIPLTRVLNNRLIENIILVNEHKLVLLGSKILSYNVMEFNTRNKLQLIKKID